MKVVHRATIAVASIFFFAVSMAGNSNAENAKTKGERPASISQNPANWARPGGDYSEAYYSPLKNINTANIKRLGLAWYADFDTNRGQEATPLVIDGILYTSTSWSKVYAYDAATGRELWRYDPQVPPAAAVNACCDIVNRGVSIWNGKVYVGTLDGRLQAIDAKTGQLVWSTMTVDPTKPYTITGAPRVAKGLVLIGQGGADLGVRGYLSAYNAETGGLVWRFYTTPNPRNEPDNAASDEILMKNAYSTWGEGVWKQSGGGGTPWDAIVYDPDFDQIIFGVGNGSPWNHRVRSGGVGDNLFLGSVVALDVATGKYKWHYQQTPAEEWDFTSTQPIILNEMKIAGQDRKVLLHAPKNGFFYVIDRKDGKLVSAKNFVDVNWASGIDLKNGRPIEMPGARYSRYAEGFKASPGPHGAHNWNPMAFSPKTGLTYIPAQEILFEYKDDPNYRYDPALGSWNIAIGSPYLEGPSNDAQRRGSAWKSRGALIAWDAVKQREAWRVQHSNVATAGVLATGGNLVFQGTPDGQLVAYRADDGKKVWSWQGFDGIIAAAMSYSVKGEQFVAVLAGFGGATGLHVATLDKWRVGTHGRLLVFKLDGNLTAADNTKPVLPPVIANEAPEPELIRKGAALYGHCASCHGFGTYGSGAVPDLRRSPLLSSAEAWRAVVMDGALSSRGMPAWKDKLSNEDAQAIRAFVSDRAKILHNDSKSNGGAMAK